MTRPNDSQLNRERKAAKILAIMRDFLGADLSDISCLDIGCREGIITKALAEHFRFVIGIDITASSSPKGSSIFAQADGKQLPFPNNHLDVIICAQVYEHADSPTALIREIHRVLKPGGAVFFSGPNRWAVIEEHYHLPFLSWLPRSFANLYMRLARRGGIYDVRPLSYGQLRQLWRGFEIHDYTPELLHNPSRFAVDERVRVKIPRRLARLFRALVPNFNWILVKPPRNAVPSPEGRAKHRNRVPDIAYTQEYYLTECDGHAEFTDTHGTALPKRLSRPLEIADIQPGQSILDIGCGRGEIALHCAQSGALVWGLDYATAALRLARSLPSSPKMAFQQADACNLPFSAHSFDTVFMLDVVEHLHPDALLAALNEAWRALKPGGRLIIHTMPNLWYYRCGYPLFRLVQRLRGQNLPKEPGSRWGFAHLHVNEQDPLKLRKALLLSKFQPKIWLESTQNFQHESNHLVRAVMRGLTRIPPFKWIFCNDIFAVGHAMRAFGVGNLSYAIAIEALGIHDYGGGRTATLNLLHNLLALDQENHYLVILSAPEPGLVARNLQQLIAPTKNRFLMRAWAQLVLPIRLRHYDLIHFVKNLAVFGMPIPSIVTMYDMTTLIYSELFPKADVWYWRKIQKHALRVASQVIAISETTRQDVQTYFGVDPAKISVIYPSIHPRFQPAPDKLIAETRRRYNLPEKYILHVGRIDIKNNITLLIEAFAHYTKHLNQSYQGALAIVGEDYAKSPEKSVYSTVTRLALQSRVIFTGRVPDSDLPAIYSGAQATVITSHHEGFGLAAVEALACGTPLIANPAGAISEVTGDAAWLLDPLEPESLALAIDEVLSSQYLQTRMREAGIRQAQRYQNQNDALETLKLYRKIVHYNRA